MKVVVESRAINELETDLLLVPLLEQAEVKEEGPLKSLLDFLGSSGEFKGERGQLLLLRRPAGFRARRLALLGLGRESALDYGDIRQAVRRAVREPGVEELDSATFLAGDGFDAEKLICMALEGIVLAAFPEGRYRSEKRGSVRVGQVSVAGLSEEAPLSKWAERSFAVGEAVNIARRLIDEPGNRMTPRRFVGEVVSAADGTDLRLEVLDEKEIHSVGLRALEAVAQGSHEPARLLILEHRGASDSAAGEWTAFIGKGVTFDSGGLSLKPSSSMEEMKADKAGAAAVAAALVAISRLGIRKNVVGILPLVENLPGGRAQRPGDVIDSLSGKTIEVMNTDAEGRLILADAITYARQRYSPSRIIDVATLTGACVVALGHLRAGFFCNEESLARHLEESALLAGERIWRLPLDPEYRDQLKSRIADIKNVGSRWGGAVTAAKFLEEFVGGTPWSHLDIAGMDFFQEGAKAGSPRGFAVSTLIELSRR